MAVDVEGIAPRFRSSVEQVAFPLDAAKRAKMSMRTTHHVIDEDGVEFGCGPLVPLLVRNQQFGIQICTYPFSQFRRQPTQDRMCCTVLVAQPFWLRVGVRSEVSFRSSLQICFKQLLSKKWKKIRSHTLVASLSEVL